MKRYLFSLIVLVLLVVILLCGGPAEVWGYSGTPDFYGIITTTNNSTAAGGISSNISGLKAPNLISAGFLNSSANNCAIQSSGADIAFMPGYGTNPWIIWAGDMAANSVSDSILYAKNVTGGKIRYFPGVTGMSTTDNDTSLEPAANFTMQFDGYINTDNGSGKTIFSHYDTTNGGIQCLVSPTVSGNITVQLLGSTTDTIYLFPVAAGTYTDLVPVGSAANWQCVDDPIASPDDDATYNWNYTTGKKDTFNLTSPTWLGTSQNITSVTVYFRHERTGGVTNTAQPWLRLGTTDSSGTGISSTTSYVTSNQVFTRPGGGSWVTGDFSSLQAGAGVGTGDSVNDERITQVYVAVSYSYTILSVTGVPSGEYVTRIKADGTNMWMTIGSYTSANVSIGSGIPNSSANWTTGSDTATPYINTWDVTIGGTLRQHIQWEYGIVFHDTTSYHNDATPSFRTNTSDSDVTSVLSSFSPISQPKAPDFALGIGPDFFARTTVTANFTSGNQTLDYPLKNIIDSISSAGGVPSQIPSTYIAAFFLIVLSLATSYFLKQQSAASLFVKSVVNIAGYGILVALHIFDWWMLIFYLIFELAIWLGAKERRE
jgi:hypothetical protein